MSSVLTGGPRAPSADTAPAAAAVAYNICCCNTRYLQSVAAVPVVATPRANDLSFERSKYNGSDSSAGAFNGTALFLTTG